MLASCGLIGVARGEGLTAEEALECVQDALCTFSSGSAPVTMLEPIGHLPRHEFAPGASTHDRSALTPAHDQTPTHSARILTRNS